MPESSTTDSSDSPPVLVLYPPPEFPRAAIPRESGGVIDDPARHREEISIEEVREARRNMRSCMFDLLYGERGLLENEDLTPMMEEDAEVILECAEGYDGMRERLQKRELTVAEYVVYRFHEAMGNDGLIELDSIRAFQIDDYQIDIWAINFINLARLYVLAIDNRGELSEFAQQWELPDVFDPLEFYTYGVLKEGAVNELTKSLLDSEEAKLQKEGIVVDEDEDACEFDDDDDDEPYYDEDEIDFYGSVPVRVVYTYFKKFPGTIIVLPGSVELYDDAEDGGAVIITIGSLRPPIRVSDYSDNTLMRTRGDLNINL